MSNIRERLFGTAKGITIRDRLNLNDNKSYEYGAQYIKDYSDYKKKTDSLKNLATSKGIETAVAAGSLIPTKSPFSGEIDVKKNTVQNKKFSVEDYDMEARKNRNDLIELKKTEDYKQLQQEAEKAFNKQKVSKYNYEAQKIAEDDVTLWDKTGGNITRALTGLFDMGGYELTNENGEKYIVPSLTQLKQDKVSQSYDTKLGKFLGDATHEITKIGATTAINAVAPGVGSGIYFGDMFLDSTKNAVREGYDSKSATIYGLVSIATEYLTGRFLGSATKGLTGGKTSTYETFLNDTFNKILKKPMASRILANASSEATEEFLQEYMDNVVKLAVLDKSVDFEDYKSVFKSPDIFSDALYSAGIGAVSGGAIGTVGDIVNNNNSDSIYQTYKNELLETRKNTTNKEEIEQIDNIITEINKIQENGVQTNNNIQTVEDIVESEQESSSFINKDVEQLGIVPYTQHEINNFKGGKVKIVQSENDISSFVESSKKAPSNAKLYFGKIGTTIANKIKQTLGINLENYNLSLKSDSIRHILNHHGASTESLRGQVSVTMDDFKLLPEIVANYDNIKESGISKQGKPSITFEKQIGDNYYVVTYVSDKSNSLEVQTMYKIKAKEKNSATVSDASIPRLTSETNSGTSSFSDNNIAQNDQNVKLPTVSYSNMQNNKINTKKVSNPLEISRLTPEDANTTPLLPKTANKNKVQDGNSHFVKNIKNKVNMLNADQKAEILSKEEVRYYDKVTNKESLEKAFKRINDGGRSEALRWANQKSKKANATDVAEGWILLKQYADNGDYDGMVVVAKKMREIGTNAGQTVQAFNIMARMTPEGMVKYAQTELMEAYDNMVKGKTKEWIDKHKTDFDLTPQETSAIVELMKKVSTMEDGYEKRVELAKIQKIVTDKLPPSRGAGIKSWMRISMLFNPKTQIRNVAGNAIIAPVNYFSDLFSSMTDKIVGSKTGYRTTGVTNIPSYVKGFKEGLYQSYNDFIQGINTRNIQGNRFEIGEGKSFNNNTAIGKSLNRVDSLLSFMLDAGDRSFYEATFTNSINNQLVLNNTTEVTQEMVDIATQEALSRTWQDNNNYTKFVLNIRKGLNIVNVKGYGLGDVLIPFAKTPANLTKAIVDYSPAGLVNTLVKGKNLKNAIETGQFTPQMQHDFVQSLGKATAGTMLYVLGYSLAKAGIVSGESDDDKDVQNFMKNTMGINSYSIKIGNKSFAYDWAQPIAAPFAMMANLVQKKEESDNLLENVTAVLDTGLNVIFEQSFLTSINDVLSEPGEIGSKIGEQLLDLPARAIPTFMKQIVDLTDGTQRTSFEYGKPIESMINSVKAKIPGLSKTLAPSVDTMGREIQRYGGKNNIFNVFLNPANVSTENISTSAKEIYRLYKNTGDATIMPRVAPYYINQDGEKITLNSSQRAEYQKISGAIIENSIKDLLETSKYKNMTDVKKTEIVNDIINYSYNKAREDVLNIPMSDTYNKINYYVDDGGTPALYYLNKEEIDYSYNNPVKYKTITQITDYDKYLTYQNEIDDIKEGYDNSTQRKIAVISYVDSLNLLISQKAMLIKLNYPSYDYYNQQIVEYINNQSLTTREKSEILTKLGFEVKDGRVY